MNIRFGVSQGQKDQINEVCFSHSGDFLFVPTGAGAVVTYAFALEGDVATLTEFHRYDAHACVINCIGGSYWKYRLNHNLNKKE